MPWFAVPPYRFCLGLRQSLEVMGLGTESSSFFLKLKASRVALNGGPLHHRGLPGLCRVRNLRYNLWPFTSIRRTSKTATALRFLQHRSALAPARTQIYTETAAPLRSDEGLITHPCCCTCTGTFDGSPSYSRPAAVLSKHNVKVECLQQGTVGVLSQAGQKQ